VSWRPPRTARLACAVVLAGALAMPAAASAGPAAVFAPVPAYFPSVQLLSGAVSAGSVALRNTSDKDIVPEPATISGGLDPGAFSIVADSCAGRTLEPDEACTIDLLFAPAHAGPHGANLSVGLKGGSDPLPAQLAGSGITPPRPAPPVNLTPPTISGTPDEGDVLTCAPGTWSEPGADFDYFWSRGGEGIQDAAGAVYRIQYDDVGYQIGCRAFASTAGGRTPAVSATVVPVDRLAPTCTIKAADQKLATVIDKGFLVTVTCSEPVTARFLLTVSAADRKRYDLPTVGVGRLTGERIPSTAPLSLRIPLDRTDEPRLESAKRVKITASVTTLDRVNLPSAKVTATSTAKR
jgi:hypothetical protein